MGAAQLSAQQLTRKTNLRGMLGSEALQGQPVGTVSAPQSREKSGQPGDLRLTVDQYVHHILLNLIDLHLAYQLPNCYINLQ